MDDPFNSPWAAFAGQAASNLTNMGAGRPVVSPIQAYQTQVMRRAQMNQRMKEFEEAQKLTKLQIQQAEQDLDPFYAYRQGLERGLLPPGTSYGDFQKMQSGASSRPVRTFIGEGGTMQYIDSSGNVVDTGAAASPPGEEIIDVGGVPYVQQTLPGGEIRTTPLDQYRQNYRTQRLEQESGAEAAGASWGTYDAEFEQNIPGARNSLSKTIEFVGNLADDIQGAIDRGEDTTGFIEGRWQPYVDRATAYLNTMSTLLTIPALKEAKLQPVTEQELRTIRETFASVLRDPEANLGSLQAQLEWLEPRLAELDNQIRYFQQNRTMRGYGGLRDSDVNTGFDEDLGDIPN